jgi:putative transposase
MKDYQSLNHTRWECKYHVIFIPKCRRKTMYGNLRRELRRILHDLAKQKDCKILEGHLCEDHVHMLIQIPPKYAVSDIIGYMKGKSAIQVARTFLRRGRNYRGYHFWARGYFVSTVGADEETVRKYIRNQESTDRKYDQQRLF